MATKLFLWITILLFSFHVAGHLFDMIANQPNWRSGLIDDVKPMVAFYSKSNPAYFFAPILFGSTACSLVTCILIRRSGKRTKLFSWSTFIISVIVLLGTVLIFVPINNYLFNTKEYDAALLLQKVTLWIRLEYVRVALLVVGLITAISALNSYTKK